MAHIVGVPRREPCKHCGLPVFFAERLAIDGSFYHRKCLRCARCDSQLTPGSFYETEVDGVFCCETCPDEEKKIQRLDNNNVQEHLTELSTQVANDEHHRQSFSDKLAMFQTNGKGLLQKSLSDEEKSKSLKRLTELYSKNCAHDANDIKSTINETEVVRIDDNGKNTDDNVPSTSDNSDEDDDSKPPSLPKTLPPSLDSSSTVTGEVTKPRLPPIPSKANVLNKLYGKNQVEKMHQNHVKSNVHTSGLKFHAQTSENTSIGANEELSQIEPQNKSANEMNHTWATPITPKINSQIDAEKVNSIESNLNTNNSLPLDALNNSFTNVTKENAEFIEASRPNDMVHHLEDKRDSNCIDNDDNSNVEQATDEKSVSELEPLKPNEQHYLSIEKTENKNTEQKQEQEQEQKIEDEEQSISGNDFNENKSIDTNIDKLDTNKLENITVLRERQSSSISDNDSQKMVRSRLSQFEALMQSSSSSSLELKQTPHHSPRLNRISATAAQIADRQCNERKKSIDDKINVTNATEAITQLNVELEPSTRLSLNANDDNDENNVNSNASINADSDKILNTLDTNNFDAKKPVPRQRAALNVYLDEDANNLTAANPPTPLKRKQKPTADPSEEKMTDKDHMAEEKSNNLDVPSTALPDSSLSSEDNERKKDEPKYPDGLNPFGSDDEEDEEDERIDSFEAIPTRRKSLNPFDSEDDEIELLKESTPKKVPTNHR